MQPVYWENLGDTPRFLVPIGERLTKSTPTLQVRLIVGAFGPTCVNRSLR